MYNCASPCIYNYTSCTIVHQPFIILPCIIVHPPSMYNYTSCTIVHQPFIIINYTSIVSDHPSINNSMYNYTSKPWNSIYSSTGEFREMAVCGSLLIIAHPINNAGTPVKAAVSGKTILVSDQMIVFSLWALLMAADLIILLVLLTVLNKGELE